MDTLSIIVKLMEDHGCDNLQLASALGLNRQLITDWKAKRSKSYTKYLPQIADFFGVTVDYLLGNEEKKPTPATISTSDLTPEEQLILLRYRSASNDIKLAVRKILDVPTGKEELVAVYHAAHTDDCAEDKIIYRTKEEIAAMENAPESDIDI